MAEVVDSVDENEIKAISAGEPGCLENLDTEKSAADTIAALERTTNTK